MNMILPFFLMFIVILTYFLKRSDRKTAQLKDSFREREHRANSTRRKDIDHLDYIAIPLEALPFEDNPSPDILRYQNRIRDLAGRRILNLSGLSNTELKLKYGVANLDALMMYDNNFNELINTIANWGAGLIEENKTDAAITILEFGVSCGSDISRNYYMLAECYSKRNEQDKIKALRNKAESINTLMHDKIIAKLDSYLT